MTSPAATVPAHPPVRTKGCCVPLSESLAQGRAGELAETFRALADPTRVQMLHSLMRSQDPVCVCDFTAAYDLSQPTISHHLARLRDAGFVTSFKRGVWAFYQLREDMPESARAALALVH